jgi:hypothetical protein
VIEILENPTKKMNGIAIASIRASSLSDYPNQNPIVGSCRFDTSTQTL